MILDRINNVQYETLDDESVDEAIALVSRAFTGFEPMAHARAIPLQQFIDFMAQGRDSLVKGSLTVIGRDCTTRQVITVSINEDLMPPPSEEGEVDVIFHPIFSLLGGLSDEYRNSHNFKFGECLHIFMLAVDEAYKGQNLAKTVIAQSVKNAAALGYHSMVTEATGNISQHIFAKTFGFRELKMELYEDFEFEGERVFEHIIGHRGVALMDAPIDVATLPREFVVS